MDCLAQRKTTVVTRPGHPKHGVLVIAETIAAEIEESQVSALTQNSCNTVPLCEIYSCIQSSSQLLPPQKKRGEEYIHARTHTNAHFGECEG